MPSTHFSSPSFLDNHLQEHILQTVHADLQQLSNNAALSFPSIMHSCMPHSYSPAANLAKGLQKFNYISALPASGVDYAQVAGCEIRPALRTQSELGLCGLVLVAGGSRGGFSEKLLEASSTSNRDRVNQLQYGPATGHGPCHT